MVRAPIRRQAARPILYRNHVPAPVLAPVAALATALATAAALTTAAPITQSATILDDYGHVYAPDERAAHRDSRHTTARAVDKALR